ncbi:hypothetical protein SEPCBS119000_005550 [Sporothrix epigloea]|uniref:Uncharacterized protein n=1 Tax=Sporothrix epigloea TaxID=1892477 RepID=A0ABP0E045_9PEZI
MASAAPTFGTGWRPEHFSVGGQDPVPPFFAKTPSLFAKTPTASTSGSVVSSASPVLNGPGVTGLSTPSTADTIKKFLELQTQRDLERERREVERERREVEREQRDKDREQRDKEREQREQELHKCMMDFFQSFGNSSRKQEPTLARPVALEEVAGTSADTDHDVVVHPDAGPTEDANDSSVSSQVSTQESCDADEESANADRDFSDRYLRYNEDGYMVHETVPTSFVSRIYPPLAMCGPTCEGFDPSRTPPSSVQGLPDVRDWMAKDIHLKILRTQEVLRNAAIPYKFWTMYAASRLADPFVVGIFDTDTMNAPWHNFVLAVICAKGLDAYAQERQLAEVPEKDPTNPIIAWQKLVQASKFTVMTHTDWYGKACHVTDAVLCWDSQMSARLNKKLSKLSPTHHLDDSRHYLKILYQLEQYATRQWRVQRASQAPVSR